MKKREPLEYVMAEEVAVTELTKAVEYHLDRPITEDEVLKSYPDAVVAMQRGLLIFNEEMVPHLKLREAIKNSDNEDSITDIKFITRVVASVQQNLGKGIDLQKDSLKFANKCTAYIISQPVAMLDRFCKSDFGTIQQLAGLFM